MNLIARPFFGASVAGHWGIGIGDPSPAGWLTVAGYFLTACLALGAAWVQAKSLNQDSEKLEPRFWKGLFVLFLALAFNKASDIQSWFTFFFRGLARNAGWYDYRTGFQAGIMVLVGALGFALFLRFHRWIRPRSYPARLALNGTGFLICFILLRAISMHEFEVILSWRVAGLKMNWVLELGCIFWVGLAAIWASRARSTLGDAINLPSVKSA
jgi:hypothetical protein